MQKIKKLAWALPYLVGYILWAIFYRVSPLFYDMYVMKVDYMVRNSTFIGVLKAIFFTGGCWRNARYFENVISIYFASYEWISDFLMPLVFAVGIYFTQKIITEEKKWYISLGGLGLFWCVSHGIVGQCYSYFYVLFLFPIFFMPLYIYIVNKYIEGEIKIDKWYQVLLFLLLVYSTASFGEHISCAFSVMTVWYLVKYRLCNKKFSKLLGVGTAISLFQTIYMNMYLIVKQTRPLAQDTSGLFSIIKQNFRVLIIETWLSNPIIIIVFLLGLIFAVRRDRIWLIADSVMALGYVVWIGLIENAGGIDTTCYQIAPDEFIPFVPREFWALWAVLYIGINLFVLYQLFMVSEGIAAIFFAGGCSTVPILVTPNTGWRISAFYVFMIILTSIGLLGMKEENERILGVRVILCIAIGAFGIITFIPRIGRLNEDREKIEAIVLETKALQEAGDWDINNDVMYLPGYDKRDVIAAGKFEENTYYMWNFCYVNGLDKATLVADLEE